VETATDEKILFPDEEVDGHIVRPWTLAQLVEASEEINAVYEIAKKDGAIDALSKLVAFADPSKVGMAPGSKPGALPADLLAALPGLVLRSTKHIPKIIAISLGKKVEEVERFNLGTTTAILVAVWTQNYDFLKNYFGPVRSESRKVG